MNSKLRLSVAFLLSVVFCAFTMAQDTAGQLAGTVKDANGEALPGATLNVEDVATGLLRSTVSNARGEYRFPKMSVGDYTLTATMPGFQTYKREVRVGLGTTTVINVVLEPGQVSEVLEVTSSVRLVDVTSTTSELTVRTDELMERVPVQRDTTAASLLAPATLEGDNRFGNLASFGGASVAENSYNVNGLNTTNFRNGTGGSTVPFEFIQEIAVKTGSYEAQYGRATGGVVNTVTKSGTNEFHGGVNLYFEPKSLRSESPDSFLSLNSIEERETTDINAFIGGPIIKNKLFFFALYNPSELEQSSNASELSGSNRVGSTTFRTRDEDFWGAKLDWHITPNHRIELTAFSDERTSVDDQFDYQNGPTTTLEGTGFLDRGGENYIGKYTGIFGSNLVVSAQWGENTFDRTTQSSSDQIPVIIDWRGGRNDLTPWVNFLVSAGDDTREAARIDVDYYMGNHSFRVGVDREVNTSEDLTGISGNTYVAYFTASAGNRFGLPAGTDYVRIRDYGVGGSFETVSNAWYIQDSWQVTPSLVMNLGARFESFENNNSQGDAFIKLDNQFAPRVGVSWDFKGDGTSKVFANFGRYHLPVASNTNIRLAGGETYIQNYFFFDGIGSDFFPVNPNNQFAQDLFGDGSVPNADGVRDLNIDPMYQDEFVIGYETRVGNNWSVGVRGIFREIGEVIEDITIDKVLVDNYGADPNIFTPNHTYVLANPGSDLAILVDLNGDGNSQLLNLSAEELGYPEGERNYYGLEFTFQRRWVNNWMLQGSWTWSHSYGNYEGWVRSDNGQDDAGIVNLFDHVGLMEGSYGDLPNDRRHNVKIFGGYSFGNGFSVGGQLRAAGGRPLNAFGVFAGSGDEDSLGRQYAPTYGASAFYQQGTLVPRASVGHTDSTFTLDAQAKYDLTLSKTKLTFRLDIFNAFDGDSVLRQNETAEDGSATPDVDYLKPIQYQTPRTVRLSAGLTF